MIDAAPERIDAAPAHLRSLTGKLTGLGLAETCGAIWVVWLLRGEGPPLLITSDSRDIVFKFEVFTLAIRTAEEEPALAKANKPGAASPWPFDRWHVDVLWAREWISPLELMPDDCLTGDDAQRFGWVPAGAEHACLVARGLLFTGANGSRVLIDQGAPLNLIVTSEPQAIDRAKSATYAMPLARYLEGATPPL